MKNKTCISIKTLKKIWNELESFQGNNEINFNEIGTVINRYCQKRAKETHKQKIEYSLANKLMNRWIFERFIDLDNFAAFVESLDLLYEVIEGLEN